MDANQIINFIKDSNKKTPVKVYINYHGVIDFGDCKVFGNNKSVTVFGEWNILKNIIENNKELIDEIEIEDYCRNSAIPLLNTKNINARIEPGAFIRDQVKIGNNAVIMMGAVINIGAIIGEGTMIDMGAILGGRATVGKNCHIGAGAVLAGVIEPASATPVIVEDNVLIGANAVVIEGVRIGKGAVVAAGAVVINDVPANTVVVGSPAKVLKIKDEKTISKTTLIDALRTL
jgi:2,3,4,5-tetrahydropyridine-2-carboxylate N-succinyltransferase/tetrahydrodipicolinate N-acetyltransferase